MSDRIIKTRRLRLEPLAPCHGPALESFARLWDVARYTATIPHPAAARPMPRTLRLIDAMVGN
jgi:hypothetical protein